MHPVLPLHLVYMYIDHEIIEQLKKKDVRITVLESKRMEQ